MKKAAALLLCACLLLGGCSAEKPSGDSEKLSVVTTIFPAYDFARQVFGDTADVTLLLKPGTESHSYDPSAKDIVMIEGCDLFIYNGGESDSWVGSILGGTEGVNSLRMMDAVEAVEEERPDGMQSGETLEHDETRSDEHGDHDAEYDEHIWTSPANAALIVRSVEEAAKELAPENSDTYERAAEDYIGRINELDESFAELLAGEKRCFVFGDRFPLLYFFKEYDLNYRAAFPGCGSEVEPSAQTISFLLKKLDEPDTIKTVFYIELSNHKLADTLSEEKSLPAAEFHTCHNITADDFAAGETWVSLMQRNYETIKAALGK